MSTSPESSDTEPDRPRVLFVGDDASSPQIAASLLRDAAGDRIAVETAGTQPGDPGGRSDEMLVAMGLNPAEEKQLSARVLHTADRVVVLGADIDVARLPGPSYEEWDLQQEDLASRVEALNEALSAPARKPRFAMLSRLFKLSKTICRRRRATPTEHDAATSSSPE
jgi:protein-tyrosine-phosphatase